MSRLGNTKKSPQYTPKWRWTFKILIARLDTPSPTEQNETSGIKAIKVV